MHSLPLIDDQSVSTEINIHTILTGRPFEDSFENPQWRKVKQMQPLWFCLLSGRKFEDIFENAQWRRTQQMQSMWVCILRRRPFEHSFKNTQWRKVKQMQPVWLCILWFRFLGGVTVFPWNINERWHQRLREPSEPLDLKILRALQQVSHWARKDPLRWATEVETSHWGGS